MTGPVFDSHAHYMSEEFDQNRTELLDGLPAQGVVAVMDCAVDHASALRSLAYGEKYPWLYTAAGVHPEEVERLDLEKELALIEPLLDHPKVKAVGECGLDYYWTKETKTKQLAFLEAQLKIAKRHDMPIIIHDRNAHQDTLALLQKYRPKGVVHCFSGSAEFAREILRLGLYIGFTGVITFKNARKTVEALAAVPLNRLLMETDCPWMAPEPLRGRPSNSAMIPYTAQRAAQIKGISTEELLRATCENACHLFSVQLPRG